MDDEQLFSEIIRFECKFPILFSKCYTTEFASMYYNEENPDLYDANHTRFFDYSEIDEAKLATITSFYKEKNISPRIYQFVAPKTPAYAHFEALLSKCGYTLILYNDSQYYVLKEKKTGAHSSYNSLTFKRLQHLDEGILRLYKQKHKGDDEGYRKRALIMKSGCCDFFAGYNDKNEPVVIGAVEYIDNVCRLNDIYTDLNFRNRGYCRALLRYLLENYDATRGNLFYLDTDNPIAAKIYMENGFEPIKKQVNFLVAYQL